MCQELLKCRNYLRRSASKACDIHAVVIDEFSRQIDDEIDMERRIREEAEAWEDHFDAEAIDTDKLELEAQQIAADANNARWVRY